MSEIDKLEIVIESNAQQANRSMGNLEKKIDSVTEALERCMLVAQGAVSLKGLNIDKLFSGKAMEKSAKDMGKKLSDDLIKNFNLNLSGKDVAGQVKSLSNKIANSLANSAGKPYKGAADDMEALGNIVKRHGQIAKTTSDEYQELYNWIKKSGKIKISPETAKSLGDDYKNRTPVAKQKFSTKGGIELDSYYQELKDQFPTILKEAYSVEDEFYQMENALRKFYETANSFYKPEWMEEDVWDSVINGVDDIRKSVIDAKSGVAEFGDALKNAEESGKSFSQMLGAGMDTSGIERAEALVGNITRCNRTEAQKKTRSDLKYPVQPFKDINRKFKDSRLDTDFSKMNIKQLQASISANERLYARVQQAINNMIELEGTDELGGKDWYSKIMQMNQYENAINDATEALERLQEQKPDLVIERGEDSAEKATESVEELAEAISDVGEDTGSIDKATGKLDAISKKAKQAFKALTKDGVKGMPKNFTKGVLDALKEPVTSEQPIEEPKWFEKVPGLDETGKYDSAAIEEYVNSFGDASKAANNFSAQIKRLKGELSDLASKGLKEGDGEYDTKAQELAIATERQREYNKAMKESAKESIHSNDVSKWQKINNAIKSTIAHVLKLGKTIGKISVKGLKQLPRIIKSASKPMKALGSIVKDVGKKIGLLQKKSNKGMSFGRMIGSSLIFSTLFGLISQIKQAIKEGSDNLVQYSGSYNNSISSMVSSLLYLKNAWAAAFAPIINVVAPYISAFIDMVASALNAVGQLMSALTGKSVAVQAKKTWTDYASGLDSTKGSANDAEKALKDLQNYTLGIDELNVIQPNDSSSSGSGGSGSGESSPYPSDMFATESIDGGVSEFAQKLKDAWAKADFTEIGGIVGQKLKDALGKIPWDKIQETSTKIGKSIGTFINGAVETNGLGTTLGQTIGEAVNTGIYGANAFLDNTKWDEVGKFIGDGLNGILDTIDFEAWGHYFAQKWNAVFATIGEAARTFKWSELGVKLADGANTFITDFDWAENGARLGDLAKGLLDSIIEFFEKTDSQQLGDNLAIFVRNIDWTGVVIKLAEGIGAVIGGLAGLLWGFIKDAWKSVVKWWKDTAFEDGKFTMEGLLNGIWEKLKDIGTWIKEHIFQPFIDGFKNAFGIHSPSTVMAEQGGYIMDGLLNGVTDKLQPVLDFFGDMKDKIVDKFSDVKDWFGDKFGKAREAISEKFSDVGTWFGKRKSDVQTNMDSISTWFKTKYQGARSNVNSAFLSIGSWFGLRRKEIEANMSSIATWFGDVFRRSYNGITAIFDNIGSYFEKVGGWISTPIKNALNGVREAVNWIYGKLGGKGDLIEAFATGTGGNGVTKDTIGMVNDQAGGTYRELVQFPNGRTIIPTGRNVVLPMPKGTKVLPAGKTKELMQARNIPHFKNGIGDFFGGAWAKFKDFTGNVFSYITNPGKLVQLAIDHFTNLSGAIEPGLSMAKGAVNTVFDLAVDKVKGLFTEFGQSNVSYNASKGVQQWADLAEKALRLTNQYSVSNLNALLMQMQHESGGNPNAINLWDSNAKKGIPSKGLMQVIDPTFRSYAMSPYDSNIYDPLSNMVAAIRYTVSRYGSLYRGWTARGYKGYKNGGMPVNGEVYIANENGFGSEYIGRMGSNHVVANNQQIVQSVSSGVERANDETNALLRQIINYQERLLKKDSSVRIDSKKVNRQLSRGSRNSGYSFSTV